MSKLTINASEGAWSPDDIAQLIRDINYPIDDADKEFLESVKRRQNEQQCRVDGANTGLSGVLYSVFMIGFAIGVLVGKYIGA